ncbi:unnamed protein product [Brassicogethes aeneus]|uniref:CLIP domain-containing serine protease n=1 Tax=Brassicogethes aeneus TaxID=1431903 RepID=A0A9P0AX70_BRAAE|nr:unnamed protein product [Brassicogethes aeneus]
MGTTRLSLISVLVQCFGLIVLINGQDIDSCSTPRSKPGNCLVIHECPSLYQLLQRRPIKRVDSDYLRNSQCGFQGTFPKVCCPIGSEPESQSTPVAPPRPTSRPTISGGGGSQGASLLPTKENCGVGTENRIYGGEKTDLDEFPWMALIQYERPNKLRGFYCGGVLINNKYILTAAHCVIGKDLPKDWKLISVRLGEYNLDDPIDCITYKQNNFKDCAPEPQDIAVEDRIPHFQYDPYDPNQPNDIALLRLVRPAVYTDYVKPICLPSTPAEINKNYIGKKVFVAGWGKTESKTESNIKLKLQVPVKSPDICTTTYRKANVALSNSTQICAGGEKGKDSCRGDSGGPLMSLEKDENGNINWFSIGVVSFGPSPCGMENWPGVYTNIAHFMPWIYSQVKP